MRYQLSRFLALVNNRQIAHEATAYAINSENSAMRENAAYMESYEARINLMKTAWQEFSLAMGDAIIGDTIIALTNSLTGLASMFTQVVNKVGLLPPVLGAVATAIALLNKNFRITTVSLVTFGKGIASLEINSKTARAALMALGTSLKGLVASTVVGAAFVGLGILLENLISQWAKYTEEVKKAKEEQEIGVESLRNSSEKIEELVKDYRSLSTQTSLNTSESEKLLQVQNDLYQLLPSLAIEVDKNGQAHLYSADMIALEIERLKDLQKHKDIAARRERDKNRDNLFQDIEKQQKSLKEAQDKLSLAEDAKNSWLPFAVSQKDIDEAKQQIDEATYEIKKAYGELAYGINDYVEANLRLSQSYDILSSSDKKYLFNKAEEARKNIEVAESVEDQEKAYSNAQDTITELGKSIANMRTEFGAASASFETEELLSLSENQKKAIIEVQSSIQNGKTDWNVFKTNLESSGISADKTNKILSMLATTLEKGFSLEVIDEAGRSLGKYKNEAEAIAAGVELFHDSVEFAENGVVRFTGAMRDGMSGIEGLQKSIDDTMSSINNLSSAYTTLADGQSLSHDTMLDLINKYPTLAKYLAETGDLTFNNGEMLKSVAEIERQVRAEEVRLALESVENKKNELESKQNLIRQYYENYLKAGYSIDNWMIGSGLTKEEKEELNKYTQEYSTLLAQLKILEQPLSFKSSKKSTSSSSSSSKDAPKRLDPTKAKINEINKAANELAETNEKLEESIESLIASGNYNQALSDTNDLYRNQKKEINLLIKANKELLSSKNNLEKNNSKYKNMSLWFDKNGEATTQYFDDYNALKTGSAQEAMQKVFDEQQQYIKAIIENNGVIDDLYKEINNTVNNTLELIQSVADDSVARSNRKISLLGNINTQEEKELLVKYTEEIITALKTEKTRIFNEVAALDKLINDPNTSEPMRQIALENRKKYADLGNSVNLEIIQEAEKLGQVQAEALVHSFNQTIEGLEYQKSLLGDSEEDKKKAKEISEAILEERLKAREKLNNQIIELERKLTTNINNEERMRVQTKLDYLQEYNKDYYRESIAISREIGQAQAESLVRSFNQSIEELEYEKSLLGNSEEDTKRIAEINAEIIKQRIAAQAQMNLQILQLEKDLAEELDMIQQIRLQTELENLRKFNREYKLETANLLNDIKKDRESWADNIIANYKKMLEKQKELELDALDRIEEAEKKNHENTMSRYKKELDSIKEIIDTQLKAFERENETEDYDREMSKLISEESDIQSKLNLARLDDSLAGKARVKELEEDLANIREQIEDKRRERERTLQRNTLEDLLEDREKHISELEEAEDERHESELERIETEKEKIESKYQSMLEDEKFYYEMKQNLMSDDTAVVEGQLAIIKSKYGELFSELTKQAEELGTMFSTLNSNFQLDFEYLDKIPSFPSNTQNSESKLLNEREAAWKEYLENKRRAEAMGSNKGDEFYKLKSRNDELRDKYKFIDGSYADLKDLEYYHDGGEVGTGRKISDWLKKYLKSDEIPAILKRKELVLNDPNNFANQIISSALGSLSAFQPVTSNVSNNTGTTIGKIDVFIEGGVKDGLDFAEKFVGSLSRKGVRIGRR